MIYHDSQDIECRKPFGAAEISSAVTLTVTADYACGAVVRTWTDEEGEKIYEMTRTGGDDFSADIVMPSYGTLLWYYFIIYYPSGDTCMYGAPRNMLGGIGEEYQSNPNSFQITVYKPFSVPEWFKNSIMYQIFPDRFFKGSDFEENQKKAQRYIEHDWYKIPEYIKNDAGEVTTWNFYGGTLKGIEEKLPYLKSLNIGTVYLNPIFEALSNHRYDTANYMNIDPLLGSEESFRSLCKKAEECGIKIIFDGVFSHTGKESIYFREDSPYREWFMFDNGEIGYKCWWGVKDLPEVDETNASYINYILGSGGVVEKWIKAGAGGIRLDVADELPDSFIKKVRSCLKNIKSDAVLIGEVWEDASNKISHGEKRKYLMGEELDGTMNYPVRSMLLDFANGKCSGIDFTKKFIHLMENYPKEALYSAMNLLGSHDRERLLTLLGSEEKIKMLYTLLFCLPGVPCIYYGDEAGLTGELDPENRACYPWGRENKDLLDFFISLTAEYKKHSALADGEFEPVYLNQDVVSFIRKNDKETLLVTANRTDKNIKLQYKGKEYEISANRTIFTTV